MGPASKVLGMHESVDEIDGQSGRDHSGQDEIEHGAPPHADGHTLRSPEIALPGIRNRWEAGEPDVRGK
jgi:hypothetical protein